MPEVIINVFEGAENTSMGECNADCNTILSAYVPIQSIGT